MELRLFARHAERLHDFKSPRVQVVEGDARSPDALKKALQGQDIVISALGGMDLGDVTQALVETMEEAPYAPRTPEPPTPRRKP